MVGGLSSTVPWDTPSGFAPPPRQDLSSCYCLLSPVVSILKTVTSIAQRKRHPLLYKWLRASALGREMACLSRGWRKRSWFRSGPDQHKGELWGDLAMALQLAWLVLSLPSCTRAPPQALEQPARCMALNQEGFSCHPIWAAQA